MRKNRIEKQVEEKNEICLPVRCDLPRRQVKNANKAHFTAETFQLHTPYTH